MTLIDALTATLVQAGGLSIDAPKREFPVTHQVPTKPLEPEIKGRFWTGLGARLAAAIGAWRPMAWRGS